MERRSFVRQAGLAGILAAGAAPAVVHAQANIRWRLTSAFPKALDTIYGAADTFAKSISDMSGGKFQISVHPSGELVGGFGQVDAALEREAARQRRGVGVDELERVGDVVGGPAADASSGPLRVLATTGMIADVAARIAGPHARVEALMGPGVDLHLYKASEGDVRRPRPRSWSSTTSLRG